MLSGYLDLGRVEDAFDVFSEMPCKNQPVMISGFVRNGLLEEGLELFNRMRAKGVKPSGAAQFLGRP